MGEENDLLEEDAGITYPPEVPMIGVTHPGVVKVDHSYALLVFFYHADVPFEQRSPIMEGDLLKEVNFQASQSDRDFP